MSTYLPDVILRDAKGHKAGVVRRRTIADYLKAMEWSYETGRTRQHVRSGSLDHGRWAGETMERYIEMVRDGWPEGLQDATGLDGLSTDRAERLTFVRRPAGAFPVVPAHLASAPDSMLMPTPQQADTVRGLTLVVPTWMTARVDHRVALTYAQQVMSLIAWLQAEQIQTNIWGVSACEHDDKRIYYAVQLRRSEDIMQPERIAACIHPAFMRRGWFSLVEYEGETTKLPYSRMITRSCYGSRMFGGIRADDLRQMLPDAYSVIVLPEIGESDPEKTVRDALSLKLRQED